MPFVKRSSKTKPRFGRGPVRVPYKSRTGLGYKYRRYRKKPGLVKRRIAYRPRYRVSELGSKAMNYWYKTDTNRTVAVPGAQNYIPWYTAYGGAYGSGSDLDTIRSDITTAVGAARTTKICICSIKETYYLTNSSNGTMYLTILDVVPRMNSTVTPESSWTAGLADMQGGAGSITSASPGILPYLSPEFNKLYRVIRKTKMIMFGGKSRIYQKYTKRGRNLDMAEVYAGNFLSLRGLTTYTFFILMGFPANDQTTKSQVEPMEVVLDSIQQKMITYKWSSDVSNSLFGSTNIPVGFTVNQSIINPTTNVVQTGVILA